MIPVMTRAPKRNPRFAHLDAGAMKIYLAGEPVTPEVQRMWEDSGARTLILYGMTESMAVCVTCNSFNYGDEEWAGKGLTGIPNREFGEVKLIDPLTDDEITEAYQQGEICFRGDCEHRVSTVTRNRRARRSTRKAGFTRLIWESKTKTATSRSEAAQMTSFPAAGRSSR